MTHGALCLHRRFPSLRLFIRPQNVLSGPSFGRPYLEEPSLEDGQIIRLSYDMWLENVEGVFDTTDRDRASESGIFNPQHNYGPIITIVGAGRVVPGLEKAIKEQGKVGEWVEVDLSPEEAYGPRDPKKIETVPMQRFKQSKVKPEVGARIQYKNRPATISRVAGGRVWVDTNSPLAGREVKYRFKIDEVVEGTEERVKALLELGYRPGIEFDVKVSEKTVEVTAPDQVKYDQHWPVAKFRIAHDIGRYTDLDNVRFVEEYKAMHPEQAAAQELAEETPAPAGEEGAASAGEEPPAETEATQ